MKMVKTIIIMQDDKKGEKKLNFSKGEVEALDEMIESELFNLSGLIKVNKNPVFNRNFETVKSLKKKVEILRSATL